MFEKAEYTHGKGRRAATLDKGVSLLLIGGVPKRKCRKAAIGKVSISIRDRKNGWFPKNDLSMIDRICSSPFSPRLHLPRDMLSPELENTLHRALYLAAERKHEFATLEHLLLALTEDASASRALQSVNADLVRLRETLVGYLDTQLEHIKSERMEQAKPTAGFQRVLQRAAIKVQASGQTEVAGVNILISIFSERESHAAYFLQQQEISRDQLVNALGPAARRR